MNRRSALAVLGMGVLGLTRGARAGTATRIVVVGPALVGKTNMLISYTTNAFAGENVGRQFATYQADVGIDGKVVTVFLHDPPNTANAIQLQSLYAQSSVILVMFSIISRSSLEEVRNKWVPEIKSRAPGVPFMLVGGKNDLRNDPATVQILKAKGNQAPLTESDGKAAAAAVGAFAYGDCSALTQAGLKNVFDTAIRQTFIRRK